MVALSGTAENGWAAVDDFSLKRSEACLLKPHDAEPATTQKPETTSHAQEGRYQNIEILNQLS